jgi:hypothetical protein
VVVEEENAYRHCPIVPVKGGMTGIRRRCEVTGGARRYHSDRCPTSACTTPRSSAD